MPISDKNSRHTFIREIISNEKISTQAELVKILQAKGKNVTQATVSRDLKDMGVYTDRDKNSKSYYILPKTPQIAVVQRDQLQRVLGEWTEDILVAGNFVVIKTAPGSAHVIASALDRSNQPEIVATLAGDDTVFIVVKDKTKNPTAHALAKELKNMTGL